MASFAYIPSSIRHWNLNPRPLGYQPSPTRQWLLHSKLHLQKNVSDIFSQNKKKMQEKTKIVPRIFHTLIKNLILNFISFRWTSQFDRWVQSTRSSRRLPWTATSGSSGRTSDSNTTTPGKTFFYLSDSSTMQNMSFKGRRRVMPVEKINIASI